MANVVLYSASIQHKDIGRMTPFTLRIFGLRVIRMNFRHSINYAYAYKAFPKDYKADTYNEFSWRPYFIVESS